MRRLDLKIARSHYAFSVNMKLSSNAKRNRRSILSMSVEEEATNLHKMKHSPNDKEFDQNSIEIVQDVRGCIILICNIFYIISKIYTDLVIVLNKKSLCLRSYKL